MGNGPGTGRSRDLKHPDMLGVINYNKLSGSIKQVKMADRSDGFFIVLQRLQIALSGCNFPSHCLKPLQVKCFEYLLRGNDVLTVFPTGFGKSILFQLLPKFFPVKADNNIVIVVCPLNSIIEDQLKILEDKGVTAGVFRIPSDKHESLFNSEKSSMQSTNVSNMLNDDIEILFAHPEALLSKEGRELMSSEKFQKNVVACAVDDAHCVELW